MRWGEGDHAFEVLVQRGAGGPVTHMGSVRAGDAELAWHAAKEAFTRREPCSLLWVVPRSAILMSDADDVAALQSSDRAEFRHPSYPGRHRRERTQRAADDGTGPAGP